MAGVGAQARRTPSVVAHLDYHAAAVEHRGLRSVAPSRRPSRDTTVDHSTHLRSLQKVHQNWSKLQRAEQYGSFGLASSVLLLLCSDSM